MVVRIGDLPFEEPVFLWNAASETVFELASTLVPLDARRSARWARVRVETGPFDPGYYLLSGVGFTEVDVRVADPSLRADSVRSIRRAVIEIGVFEWTDDPDFARERHAGRRR